MEYAGGRRRHSRVMKRNKGGMAEGQMVYTRDFVPGGGSRRGRVGVSLSRCAAPYAAI